MRDGGGVWQIFMDMATLVESQGELLNDIESNVTPQTSPCLCRKGKEGMDVELWW